MGRKRSSTSEQAKQKKEIPLPRPRLRLRSLAPVFPPKIAKKPRTKTIMMKLHRTSYADAPLSHMSGKMKFESNEENTTESRGGGNDSSRYCSSFTNSPPPPPLPSSLYDIPGPVPDFNHLIMDTNGFMNFFVDIPDSDCPH